MELNQYSIILVNLDPTIRSEIKKTRPCVIISPNEMNKYLRTIVVAPRIAIKTNNKKGMVAIDQIRTINKQRIVKVFDSLTKSEIGKYKEVLKETFVD